MNLKNSKFFKRIQELRRISKDKLRRQRERARLHNDIENALRERNGNSIPESDISRMAGGGDGKGLRLENGGLIQLNNVCFRMKCTTQKVPSRDDLPTISSVKGSICVSNSRYAMIGRVSKLLGFKLVKEAKLWNILWTDSLPGVELYKNMKRFQQINHFPGMMEICRKDLLSRNLNRMLKLFPRDYKIFPKTWIFPADYGEAMSFAATHCRFRPRTFIIKPDAGAQGRGIWLTNDLKTINPTERMICQTYITKPLLIDGYKFDLRVYALITSVDPLRIFVFNEGLARFATNKYVEPNADNSTDLFMHLTNYSVNKRSSQYDLCDNDDCGSKRKFSAINNWMRRRNHNVDEFWGKIDDIIIKTVLSSWPVLKHNYHACFPAHDKIQACFEILGFDVLVDSKLKPYILEVNHSPSFHTNELVDRQVKKALIRDTLTLVSTVLADKKMIMREDRKRVKQRLLKNKQGDSNNSNNNNSNNASNSTNGNNTNNANNNLNNKDISNNNTNNSNCPIGDNKPSLGSKECILSPLSQQIAWEESHLGEFRRIMPPNDPAKLNYYCQFFAHQNQASIYAETAASKKREEVAKKLRHDLEEKRQKQLDIINNGGRMKFEDRRRKRANIPRALLERQRLYRFKSTVHWTPGFISDAEERLRRSWMQMRTDIMKNMRVVEVIYKYFYNSGILTNADIVTYPELYECLENGYDITLTE